MIADEIRELFDNPFRLWMQVYNSLSPAAQATFVTTVLMAPPCDLGEVEALISLTYPGLRGDILHAERELDDTFLHFEKSIFDTIDVDFMNPSIQDFAHNVLDANPELMRPYLTHASEYTPLATMAELAEAAVRSSGFDFPRIHTWVTNNANEIIQAMARLISDYTHLSSTLDFAHKYCRGLFVPELAGQLEATFGRFERAFVGDISSIILDVDRRSVISLHLSKDYLDRAVEWAVSHTLDADDVDSALDMNTLSGVSNKAANIDALRANFMEIARKRARALGDDDETLWGLRNELEELQRLAHRLDCDISYVEAEFENYMEDMPPEDDDYDEDDRADRDSAGSTRDSTIAEIDEMFMGLLERNSEGRAGYEV